MAPTSSKPRSGKLVEYITELGPHDILLGRGTGPNEHSGNVRFRALVRDVLGNIGGGSADNNMASCDVKMKLASTVYTAINDNEGRFLRKLNKHEKLSFLAVGGATSNKRGAGAASGDDLFMAVDKKTALDKIKQSFRHQLRLLPTTANNGSTSTSTSTKVDMKTVKRTMMKSQKPVLPPNNMMEAPAVHQQPLHQQYAAPASNLFWGGAANCTPASTSNRNMLQQGHPASSLPTLVNMQASLFEAARLQALAHLSASGGGGGGVYPGAPPVVSNLNINPHSNMSMNMNMNHASETSRLLRELSAHQSHQNSAFGFL